MIPEACAVDDDRDTCDLSLGLQRYDRQDFVGEGNKLERENKMLMKKQSSGWLIKPVTKFGFINFNSCAFVDSLQNCLNLLHRVVHLVEDNLLLTLKKE